MIKGKHRVSTENQSEEKVNNSLLIIKAQPQSLLLVESFLRNRGWDLTATTSLQEAIVFILKAQPAFVMISVDHPNKKIRNLAKVITQAFPCCLIMFGESSASSSYKLLAEARAEYTIYPPVTGPAVERTILKFQKDQSAKPAGIQTESGFAANYEAPGMVNIKGKGMSLQSLMAQVMGDDTGAAGYIPNQSISSGENSAQAENSDLQLKGNAGAAAAGEMNYTPGMADSQPGTGGYDPSYSDDQSQLQINSQMHDPGSVPTKHHRDSLIFKGTKEVLSKTVVSSSSKKDDTKKVGSVSNVACVIIESKKYSGYLVAAMGENRKIDEQFFQLVRDRLFRFLSDNGEAVSEHRNMEIKIKEVPFQDWAVEQAEFLRKSVHHGSEVALAFFPYAEANVKTEDSASSDMCAISLSHLKVDVAVECNVYIYLPANQKYILYTPRGSKIYEKQVAKLTREGISHVHIRKDEIHEFNTYRAQNYFSEKIGAYETERSARMAEAI